MIDANLHLSFTKKQELFKKHGGFYMNSYATLTHYVDYLIKTEGTYDEDGYYLDYNGLDESDQKKLVALFIDYEERDLYSIYENKNLDDITSSLLTMLANDDKETDKDFLNCLKRNMVSYYTRRAQQLIDERSVDLESEDRLENRKISVLDRKTGEYHLVTI